MSQKLNPINGGIAQIEVSKNYSPGVYISPQYTQAKRLTPQPTEWISGGRPIYDRLPSASERYKLYFGFDGSSAYTLIPTGQPYSGPGSMQVQRSGGNKFLTIQSGDIVWQHGKIPVKPVIIDLRLLGMQNARYQIAYQVYYDDSPYEAQFSVDDFSLAGQELNIVGSTDVEPGWRYKPLFALNQDSTQSWRNYDGLFPSFSEPAFLYWQMPYSASFSKIKLRCPKDTAPQGTATLSYEICPPTTPTQKYCENPDWIFQDTVSVQRDSLGPYFEFQIQAPSFHRGWKVTWTDPKIAVNGLTVSGVVTLIRKPISPVSYWQLVAYPENQIPATRLNAEGEEIPLFTCNLALVDVNNLYEVEKITDIRQTVNTDYEPIADWLTRPWDENLMNMYEQTDNYSSLWLDPVSCMFQEYEKLEKQLVKTEN